MSWTNHVSISDGAVSPSRSVAARFEMAWNFQVRQYLSLASRPPRANIKLNSTRGTQFPFQRIMGPHTGRTRGWCQVEQVLRSGRQSELHRLLSVCIRILHAQQTVLVHVQWSLCLLCYYETPKGSSLRYLPRDLAGVDICPAVLATLYTCRESSPACLRRIDFPRKVPQPCNLEDGPTYNVRLLTSSTVIVTNLIQDPHLSLQSNFQAGGTMC